MIALLLAVAAAAAVAQAQPPALQPAPPTPAEIVAAAAPGEWTAIPPDDLIVVQLAPDAAGRPRRVVVQLVGAPFAEGWVANIRALTRAHWWDGTSVNRVQDDYVAQWGDATERKPLPAGLRRMAESAYEVAAPPAAADVPPIRDPYGLATFSGGWPIGLSEDRARAWPVHCYASVGVGRGLSPDTGSGAELYAVIGHAPRHLDRNIAVVGRVVEGIEHLSALPRGTGALGFYERPGQRVAIVSARLASDLPAAERPRLAYLATGSASFRRYAEARANRRDAFFIRPAGGADVCNVPVPVRRLP